jgi:predicted TIM-barrel fold metal-dependent hydrolase
MIIDVHCHAWQFPGDFTQSFIDQANRAKGGTPIDLTATFEDYRAQATDDTLTIVFGGKAKLSGVWVDDKFVAAHVAKHAENLIGFMSIDPTQDGWYSELREGYEELGMQGIKLLPMYAGFSPDDPRIEPIYRFAARNNLPILLHMGTTFVPQAPLAYTLPRLIEPAAVKYPEVKFILAHLGHPYEGDCIVTIRKNPNVYADISALHYRPYQLFNSLSLVQEYGVWNKVLFGTDFPFTTVTKTIEGLAALNRFTEGTNLPRLNTAKIEEMIHRDTLPLLGIKHRGKIKKK